MYAVGRGRDTRGAMSVFRVGGRAEEYIMADHLPPHNYGVRPWGVGFEMSPGQNDIMRADIWSASHLFTSCRHGLGMRDIMGLTCPTTVLRTCMWRRHGSEWRRREIVRVCALRKSEF